MDIIKKQKYILEDIKPYMPDINLEELNIIQGKIEKYTLGKCKDGITLEEAEKFLDWVTLNARNFAVREIPESITTASMTGSCAPTQRINTQLLLRLGLDVRAINIADCIGEIPMNEEDKRRIENGWSSTAVRHAIALVNIPIMNSESITKTFEFVLDPTFRQFCLEENCRFDKFYDSDWIQHGHVAPHPGFFMLKDNLQDLGETEETAESSERLCKKIISRGYFYLNEKNAKLYGDAFIRASKREEFRDVPIMMKGQDYIEKFENASMKTYRTKDEKRFTRLPSEILKEDEHLLTKFINFLKGKRRENKAIKYCEDGESQDGEKVFIGQLSEEELEEFRVGEYKVLSSNDRGTNDDNENKIR